MASLSVSARPCYSQRVDEALALAAEAFRFRVRKGSGVPYLSHLLQVMVTVAEHHGDEDQLVAAVLHDYLEDIEGASAGELRSRFGDRVATYVEALSDTTEQPKPPWRDRKVRHLERLRSEPPAVKLICAADKLHNARSLVRSLSTTGASVWQRFNAGPDDTLWYYEEGLKALRTGWSHPILVELEQAVGSLRVAREQARGAEPSPT
jgi:(p)ppGpp synthase/HD superfamily hydrolase